jgi:hypothetical protein
MEKVINYKIRRESTAVKLVKNLEPTTTRTVNGPNFGFYPNTSVGGLKSRNSKEKPMISVTLEDNSRNFSKNTPSTMSSQMSSNV